MSTNDRQIVKMNAAADIATASYFVTTLEDTEARRQSKNVDEVRPTVARRVGATRGTLENIRKLRTKVVPNWLMARIRAAFVAELQAEIGRLQHEISIAVQTGMDPREDDLAKAQAQLVEARALIKGVTR